MSSGLALGTLGHTADRVGFGRGSEQPTATQDDDDLEEAAGAAALMLGATAVAAGVGGVIGSKLWPRTDRWDDAGLRDGDDEWRSTGRTSERP